MEYTENYKLAKPEGALKFDPDYDNENYDIIDAALKTNADAAEAAQKAASNAQNTADKASEDIEALSNSLSRRFELISETAIADGDEIYEVAVEGSFEKIYIDAYLAPMASSESFFLRLNDAGVFAGFTNTTSAQYCSLRADVSSGRIFASSVQTTNRNYGTMLQCTPLGCGYVEAEAITKILLQNSSQSNFAAGTTFKIYAVKNQEE